MSIGDPICPRCDGHKPINWHVCATCAQKIAESVGKKDRRTPDASPHDKEDRR